MTKRPLRTTPPAPMPAGTLFTTEEAARAAAPKPAKGQVLELVEPRPGLFTWALRPADSADQAGAVTPKAAKRKGGEA